MRCLFILFVVGLFGCATANKALDVFRAGHNEIQEIVDETQAFCQAAREKLKENDLDTSMLETYCEKAWSHFKTYKKITDPLLEK
jgi:hypothetical protein